MHAAEWISICSQFGQQQVRRCMCAVPLTLHIIVHNVVSVQVGQCLESAPEDVFGVVHHQLQHGGLLLVLHQEVGEGTVAHLGQVALHVTTHAGHEVVAEVARGMLGVLLTHHHCLEGGGGMLS